jgi:acyl carrier protein
MDPQAKTRLREIIAVELQVPTDKVRSGLSLRKHLGMDSVAALNILFAAEETFGIHVPEGELEHVDEIDAIMALIERYRAAPTAGAAASRRS